jgi:hypothetical protein
MADQSIRFDQGFDGYVIELDGAETRYRAVVPRAMLDDETGAGSSEETRVDWVHEHLAQIIGAVTARETGGFIKEPWNRVHVEEID